MSQPFIEAKKKISEGCCHWSCCYISVLEESSTLPQIPHVETPQTPHVETSMSAATGISPGKTVQLRIKDFEQLRYLQNLFN